MKTFSSERMIGFMTVICVILSLLLFGWHAWLKFVYLANWEEKVLIEDQALADIQTQQDAKMTVEVRDFLNQYSQTVTALEAVFAAREAVFSGEMATDRFDPVLVLDLLPFFEKLRKYLSSQVILNKFSLSPTGQVSFLVQTTNYREAAKQMEAFRYGFRDSEELPQFFEDVSISSVSRTKLALAQAENLPDLLKGREASFDFFVQMQINPDYFTVLSQLEDAFKDESLTQ